MGATAYRKIIEVAAVIAAGIVFADVIRKYFWYGMQIASVLHPALGAAFLFGCAGYALYVLYILAQNVRFFLWWKRLDRALAKPKPVT
jgi:hypothetical protein